MAQRNFEIIVEWLDVMNSWNERRLEAFVTSNYSNTYRSSSTRVDGTTAYFTYQELIPTYKKWFSLKTKWREVNIISFSITGVEVLFTMAWPSGKTYKVRCVFQFADGKIVAGSWNPASFMRSQLIIIH